MTTEFLQANDKLLLDTRFFDPDFTARLVASMENFDEQGWLPADPTNPNNGQWENVLIIWRKLTGDLEKDNVMLDVWFQKVRPSSPDFKFHTVYVNGSSNLPSLKNKKEKWQVRLIEEESMKRMWEVER
ncbi:MAG: hypothetical protein ACLFT8_03550 [Desulfovermiculus sp.]